MHHTQNLKMETGIETTYKVGDKVIATTPYMGEKKERDGIIRDVQPNKYAAGFTHRVEVVVAGDTTYYWLTADKLRLAQTPASKTIKELAAEHMLASDMSLHKTMEDADAENERVALLEDKAARLDELESKAVEPPADPPKPERIRRTKEEIALGVPHKDILAYRADPEGWLKSEREATEAFHEVIDKAIDDHWEDKAQEYLEPPAYKPEIILKMLGWAPLGQDHGLQMYSRSDVAIEEVLVRHVYEDDSFFIESVSKPEYTYQWNKSEDFRMWLMRCTEWIEELLDGGVCDDNDLEGDDKPAEAVVSKMEITEPNWDKCMKAIRYDFDFLGAPPDYRIVGRQKVNGQRSYVVLHPDQPVPFFYPSVTTIIDAVIPKDKALEAWAIKEFRDAKEKAEYMDMKAAYGTVVHGAIADLVNGVLPDFEDYEGWHTYMLMATGRNGHSRYAKAWTQGTQKAVLSFVKWIQDYNVRILALELPLCMRGESYAGQIDLLVERDAYIQKKSGKHKEAPPRVIALDDIKTGSASNSYVPQLALYIPMVEQNFPALKGKIQACGLFVPQDWKREPKYLFSDKTERVAEYSNTKMQHHLSLFRQDMKKPRGVQSLFGKPAIDMNLSEAIGWKPLETVWIDKIKAGDFGSDDDVIIQEQEDDEDGNE